MKGKRKRRRKLGHVQRDILHELTLGDLLYAHLLSARSTKRFYQLARERAKERHRRKQSLEALEAGGLITRRGAYVSITAKGLVAFGQVALKTKQLLENRSWDGKLRVVAFDIPERYASLRDKLRTILKQAGFEKLQQSIWIFPHDCKELIDLIQNEPVLKKYVLYGIMVQLQNEDHIKKLFRLE
ncbi:hypothetical protein C4568_00120 [Candidatus Parcubacteria bacterium]|nr:MAG: hypothetical protein C4568_00120 [Candidatus Parcubacteria bacterium]